MVLKYEYHHHYINTVSFTNCIYLSGLYSSFLLFHENITKVPKFTAQRSHSLLKKVKNGFKTVWPPMSQPAVAAMTFADVIIKKEGG